MGSCPCRIAMLSMLLLLGQSVQADPARVALFLPHSPTPFWEQVVRVMEAAGEDLGLTLEVRYGEEGHARYLEQIRRRLARPDKPDFMVFKPYKKTTEAILRLSEAARVPAISFNTLPFETERAVLGEPRQRYKYWLAELAPDDRAGGYTLARHLVQRARARGLYDREGAITVIGINGPVADTPARLRAEGLRRAVAEMSGVRLLQVVNVDWKRTEANRVVDKLLRRHPRVSVIWTAADVFALGAAENLASEADGRESASPVIGGFDWMREAQLMIEKGRLSASVGGHFLEGGWAMVLIHDYLKGRDFAEVGVRYLTPMGLLTEANLARYDKQLLGDSRRLDFRRFSRFENPSLQSYNFSVQSVLEPFPR